MLMQTLHQVGGSGPCSCKHFIVSCTISHMISSCLSFKSSVLEAFLLRALFSGRRKENRSQTGLVRAPGDRITCRKAS